MDLSKDKNSINESRLLSDRREEIGLYIKKARINKKLS